MLREGRGGGIDHQVRNQLQIGEGGGWVVSSVMVTAYIEP